MGEKKTEQGDDEADKVRPTLGNRLHVRAAPAPVYARPDSSAVDSGQPNREDTQARTVKTPNKKKLGSEQPCKRLEKGTRRQRMRQRLGDTKHKNARKQGRGGPRLSRKRGMRKSTAYPSTYADAIMRQGEERDTVGKILRNGGGAGKMTEEGTRIQTDQAIRGITSEKRMHRGGGYLVGSSRTERRRR